MFKYEKLSFLYILFKNICQNKGSHYEPFVASEVIDFGWSSLELERLSNSSVPAAVSHPNSFGTYYFCLRIFFLIDCAALYGAQKDVLNLLIIQFCVFL